MRTLVVLPTYNEAETLEEVLRRTSAAIPDGEMLVVDDGSPDGTADLAEKIGCELFGVSVLRRDRRRGLGDAYRAGFSWGLERRFEVLVEMDSDLSHDPAALPALIDALSEHDLAIGVAVRTRRLGTALGAHTAASLVAGGGNWYAALMLGLPVRDLTSGFRAYRAELLRAIDLQAVHAEGYGFQIEMTYRAAQVNARICEVPIRFVEREHGTSKMSAAIVAEALALVTRWGIGRGWARLRGNRPERRTV